MTEIRSLATLMFPSPAPPLYPADASAALIVLPDGRYLLQHRDAKPGIFYPSHWGCFGGAKEGDETAEQTLARELREELNLTVEPGAITWFTEFTFDLSELGAGIINRMFYEVRAGDIDLASLSLSEGQGFGAFTRAEALTEIRLVPYDSFAIWLHASRGLREFILK